MQKELFKYVFFVVSRFMFAVVVLEIFVVLTVFLAVLIGGD